MSETFGEYDKHKNYADKFDQTEKSRQICFYFELDTHQSQIVYKKFPED